MPSLQNQQIINTTSNPTSVNQSQLNMIPTLNIYTVVPNTNNNINNINMSNNNSNVHLQQQFQQQQQFTQLPHLNSENNINNGLGAASTGTGTVNTVTSSNGMNNGQIGLGLIQQHSQQSYNNTKEFSPQAYSNKYQDQMIRKIANSSTFMIGSSSKGFHQSSSPTQRMHKEASKQSLGTIYSSGNITINQYNQSTRQSQFRSSRLYQKFYNPNSTNTNNGGSINSSNAHTHHHILNEIQQQQQQSLGNSMINNGGHSNQSLDRLPYSKQSSVNYSHIEKISNNKNGDYNNSLSKNRMIDSSNQISLSNTVTSNSYKNHQQLTVQDSTQLVQQLQQTIASQANKRMSLFQKRKMKVNEVSLGNISITGDERSTDIHEEHSSTNHNSIQNHKVISANNSSMSPYKTLNNFSNLKSISKHQIQPSSKQSSQLRNQNNVTSGLLQQQQQQQQQQQYLDQFKSHQRKNKYIQRQESKNLSLQNAGELISEREYNRCNTITGNNNGAIQEQQINTHTLLLRIEEDNHEVKSRSKNGNSQALLKQQVTNETVISKANSKTELPELRQSKFSHAYQNLQQSTILSSQQQMPSIAAYNRLSNNQSINVSRVNQQLQLQQQTVQSFHQSFINSQTSSRTQLAQLVNGHNNHGELRASSYFDQIQQSAKKKQSTKMNSLRINQELINNQKIDPSQHHNQNLNEQSQHKDNATIQNYSNSPKKKHQSLQPYKKKQSSQSISLKTQTSFNQSANKIRIEINKEESVLQFLTKDHKSGVSLLYYDFNNANQRLHQQKQPRVQQNLADLIIPEETEELPPLLQQVNTIKDDIARQDSAQILARIQKNQLAQTNQQINSNAMLITQHSINQQNNNQSPRNDIEIVNQKIDKARKKISRYFAQNQSLSNLNVNGPTTAQQNLTMEQNALKHLSMDVVRMGSPFFGTQIQNQMNNQQQQQHQQQGSYPNSPFKIVNNKQSDSSLKFSPIKTQKQTSQFYQNNNSIGLNTSRCDQTNFVLNEEQNINDSFSKHNNNVKQRNSITRNARNVKTIDHQPISKTEANIIQNSSPQEDYENDFSFNQDDEHLSQEGKSKVIINDRVESNMHYIDIEDQSFNQKQLEDLNFNKIDQALSMRNLEKQQQQQPHSSNVQGKSYTVQITPHLKVNTIDNQKLKNIMQLSTGNILISQDNSSYSQESFYEDQNNNCHSSSTYHYNENLSNGNNKLIRNSNNQSLTGKNTSHSQLTNKLTSQSQNRKQHQTNNARQQQQSQQRLSHQYPLQPSSSQNKQQNCYQQQSQHTLSKFSQKHLHNNTQQFQQQESHKNSIISLSKLPQIHLSISNTTTNQQTTAKSNLEKQQSKDKKQSRLGKVKRTSTVEYIKDDDEIFR